MKKISLFITICTLFTILLNAQTNYKVVFDMTSKDTINQQSLVRELTLIRKANPAAKMEVVLYGQGLDLVVKDRAAIQPAVQKLLTDKDISFKVCAFAMDRQHIEKEQLLPGVEIVPDGIYEIVLKQQEGWGYIKVGH